METSAIAAFIATVAGALGLFGWSHKSLRQSQALMEIEIYKRATYGDTRRMIADKMAPFQSEYNSLTRRIDDLKNEYIKLDEKIDNLIVICTKLTNQK